MLVQRDLTDRIIKAFFRTYNSLGYGFLEKVYENALTLELRKLGLPARQQQPIKVHYQGQLVGEYYADIVVADIVILELKVADVICEAHEAQLVNYLKATEIEIGLLLNFGPMPEFRRRVFTNAKKSLSCS